MDLYSIYEEETKNLKKKVKLMMKRKVRCHEISCSVDEIFVFS